MSARRLSTIRQINEIRRVCRNQSHLIIDGWNVVMKTPGGHTDFSIGEFVLFFEVDAWLPARGRYGELFKEVGNPALLNGENGFRVAAKSVTSTFKPYEVIRSQGHVFKLAARKFPVVHATFLREARGIGEMTENNIEILAEVLRKMDFSFVLGVKKWENEYESEMANIKIPSFVIKSDMDRVQNCVNLFKKPKYKAFIFQESVKMDGSSMTMYFVDHSSKCWDRLLPVPSQYASRSVPSDNARFGVCSKNFDLLDNGENQNKLFWDAAMKSGIFPILRNVDLPLAVQGELVGWNINGNPHGYPRDVVEFFMYSIIDLEEGVRLDPRKVEQFAGKLGLLHVPVLGYVKIPEIATSHQDILDRAERRQGEGLVFKNCDDGRWFKVHSASYLVAREEGGNNAVVANPTYPVEFAPSVDLVLPGDAKAVFDELFPKKKVSAATPARSGISTIAQVQAILSRNRMSPATPARFYGARPLNDPFVSSTANESSVNTPPMRSSRQQWEDFLGPRPSPVVNTSSPDDGNSGGVLNKGKVVCTPPATPIPITERGRGIDELNTDDPFDEMEKRSKELKARLAQSPQSPSLSPDAVLVDTTNLPRHERIKAKMQALLDRNARVARLENGLAELKERTDTGNTELMQRVQSSEDPVPFEYHSLSDHEYDGDHPLLAGMPRDGTAIIIGHPTDPTGWRIKPDVVEARAAIWRQASIDKTMRADDGGLGTLIDEWATGFFGTDNPKRPKDVNDIFFYIRPEEYRKEYRKERHPDLFPTKSALMTPEASPSAGRRVGMAPSTMSPSARADAEWLGLI